jgi:hypothetical protein
LNDSAVEEHMELKEEGCVVECRELRPAGLIGGSASRNSEQGRQLQGTIALEQLSHTIKDHQG